VEQRAHTATLVGTKLYVFGGGDGNKALNEVYITLFLSFYIYFFNKVTLCTYFGLQGYLEKKIRSLLTMGFL